MIRDVAHGFFGGAVDFRVLRRNAGLLFALVCCAACDGGEGSADLSGEPGQTSYALGYQYGQRTRGREILLETAAFQKGLEDSMLGEPSKLTNTEMDKLLSRLRDRVSERQKKQADQRKAVGEQNKAQAKKFFAENAAKEGVVQLPSGLQYEVIKMGVGARPTRQDRVQVHYRGTLLDGKLFDSSHSRGLAEFQLNQVIPGWTEGLSKMPEGSKWKLFIPSKLAYGEQGAGSLIGPHAALIFEVELVKILSSEGGHEGH